MKVQVTNGAAQYIYTIASTSSPAMEDLWASANLARSFKSFKSFLPNDQETQIQYQRRANEWADSISEVEVLDESMEYLKSVCKDLIKDKKFSGTEYGAEVAELTGLMKKS